MACIHSCKSVSSTACNKNCLSSAQRSSITQCRLRWVIVRDAMQWWQIISIFFPEFRNVCQNKFWIKSHDSDTIFVHKMSEFSKAPNTTFNAHLLYWKIACCLSTRRPTSSNLSWKYQVVYRTSECSSSSREILVCVSRSRIVPELAAEITAWVRFLQKRIMHLFPQI